MLRTHSARSSPLHGSVVRRTLIGRPWHDIEFRSACVRKGSAFCVSVRDRVCLRSSGVAVLVLRPRASSRRPRRRTHNSGSAPRPQRGAALVGLWSQDWRAHGWAHEWVSSASPFCFLQRQALGSSAFRAVYFLLRSKHIGSHKKHGIAAARGIGAAHGIGVAHGIAASRDRRRPWDRCSSWNRRHLCDQRHRWGRRHLWGRRRPRDAWANEIGIRRPATNAFTWPKCGVLALRAERSSAPAAHVPAPRSPRGEHAPRRTAVSVAPNDISWSRPNSATGCLTRCAPEFGVTYGVPLWPMWSMLANFGVMPAT